MPSIQQEIRTGAYLVVIADILERARDEGLDVGPIVVGACEIATGDGDAWTILRAEIDRRERNAL